jgi:YD repeat-containing protein
MPYDPKPSDPSGYPAQPRVQATYDDAGNVTSVTLINPGSRYIAVPRTEGAPQAKQETWRDRPPML